MKNQIMLVEYVSLWDDGVEIETTAKYNPVTGLVYDIETTDEDIEDLDILEAEFIRFNDGTELSVSEVNGEYKVIDFANILKSLVSKEEPFLMNQDFPELKESIINIAEENGVRLNFKDFKTEESFMSVDADGYPYIEEFLLLSKYNCKFIVTACHHSKWDYYIEYFSTIEN